MKQKPKNKEKKTKYTYYEKGKKKSATTFVDGKEHGIDRAWYSNGQLKHERNYTHGEMKGICREWHENGQLSWESILEDSISYNRSDKGWDENGNPDYLCEYKDGKLHGKHYSRNSDGSEIREYWWEGRKLKYAPEHAQLMIDFLTNLGYEIKPALESNPTPKMSL